MEASETIPAELAAEVRRLTDDYRARCLWFLRADLYPSTRAETLRVLRQIETHADRAGFVRAAGIRRWLSPTSSARSAGS
jgi:hypothetical protein